MIVMVSQGILQRDPAGHWGIGRGGDRELNIKRKATKIVLRWAVGAAVGMHLAA